MTVAREREREREREAVTLTGCRCLCLLSINDPIVCRFPSEIWKLPAE